MIYIIKHVYIINIHLYIKITYINPYTHAWSIEATIAYYKVMNQKVGDITGLQS